ncbi:MAG TPA: tyrosine-protein phosphatase [Povalibacter sp.]
MTAHGFEPAQLCKAAQARRECAIRWTGSLTAEFLSGEMTEFFASCGSVKGAVDTAMAQLPSTARTSVRLMKRNARRKLLRQAARYATIPVLPPDRSPPMNAQTLDATRSRVLSLEGGCNFRDIGGYIAADGRSVRWGHVYRTGVLSYFNDNDRPSLMQLGVRAICDLRRTEEREREPTRWPDAAVQSLSWGDSTNTPTVRGFASGRPRTAEGMREAMIELYRALPVWMGPRIRGLFECIAAGQTPLVVHCAAGKDRTGVAIAVLLCALGVDRQTITEDYLLTNDAGNFEQFILTRKDAHLGLADAHHPLLSMPEEMRRALFVADAAYLEAAFAQIDGEHGGVERYLSTSVHVDAGMLAKVRAQLLT